MHVLNIILQIALVIVSLLLIGVILLQRTKGAGAGVTFGGMGESVFGSEIGNVLTRSTIVLGALFVLIILGMSMLPINRSGASSSIMAGERPVAAPVQAIPSESDVAAPVAAASDAGADEVAAPAAAASDAGADEAAAPAAE